MDAYETRKERKKQMSIGNENRRGMFVYVVRWEKRIDGEEESGNFEVCYADERDAEKAMLADMENVKSDWMKDYPETKSSVGEKNGNGCSDFCFVAIEGEYYDYHEWHIDKLELVGE